MSDTITIKTMDLAGPALDWAVAKCEKWDGKGDYSLWLLNHTVIVGMSPCYAPSTDWAQGGPIIEREEISTVFVGTGWDAWKTNSPYVAIPRNLQPDTHGPTKLIAAMRCYVTSKLGDELEIPVELTQTQPKKMKL